MKKQLKLLLSLILLGLSTNVIAQNPIITHRYLADPGAMVYDGRVYIYSSNDDENVIDEEGYEMKSIVAVSSSDMKNWTDHGVVFRVPENAAWASYSWAPSPIERNGMFYLYYGNSGGGIGVARADNPAGPFTDPVGSALITTNTPGVLPATSIWLFDPMPFIDDDGQAYLYFGGNGEDNMRVIKLNEDMISVDGEATSFTVPYFFEASWMHKNDSTYYFSYSTDGSNGLRIDYMTSDNPTTGFTYGGVLAPQPPNNNNNNNHHANFQFNGTWYHAYHNRIIANQAGVLATYRRSINVDTFTHNEDGSINSVQHSSAGVAQVGSFDPYALVEAETFNAQSGINTKKKADDYNDLYVTDIEDGDWIRVRGVDFGSTGAVVFTADVASDLKNGAITGGSIEIRIGSVAGTLAGTVPVSYTGGLESFQSRSIAISNVTGTQDVYFVFKGSDTDNLFNFDKWQFFEDTGSKDLFALNTTIADSKIDTVAGENTTDISVSAVYSDGSSDDITSSTSFTFDNENVISIADGVITGLAYDTVTVYATFNSVTDSVKMVVKNLEGEITVSRIYPAEADVELFAGTSTEYTILAEFTDGHTEDITDNVSFTNPSPEIATISGGTITAVSEGEVDITVTYDAEFGGEQTTVIHVTVEQGYRVLLEAECAEVGSTWLTEADENASNGYYVTVTPGVESLSAAPTGAENLIVIPVDVDESGVLSVYARINGASADDDSFWFQVEDEGFTLYNGLVTDGWQWIKFDDYTFRRGDRTLTIGFREDGAKLDKIAISNFDAAPEGTGAEAQNICTITSNAETPQLPTNYALDQNYPNPFNPSTQINYSIPESGLVKLDIINTIGQKVATLVNERKTAGNHVIEFDASGLASGVYFYSITAGDYSQTRKMLLIK